MSSSTPNKTISPRADSLGPDLAVAIPAVIALAYGLGHLNWYLTTPLGRVPVLDERENIDLAEGIFGGNLESAPFYRAPGYACLLAGLRFLGVSAGGLFPAALLLGVLLHGTGAALVAQTARRLFGNPSAAVAGVIFALDPVLVHQATHAMDTTLALALFLAGLASFTAALGDPERAFPWAATGAFWAAAALARPNYLLVWLAAPLVAAVQPVASRFRCRNAGAALASAVLFISCAAWQWSMSGTFELLPWQGAYNLWAANRPGSNGRYYVQHVSLPEELARANPAKVESILLYAEETGGKTADIPSMNDHWRRRFLEEVSSHPLRWCTLMVRKLYALLNNWEQYNNMTYAFHKARSPWLRWNPIGWGLVLVLAVAGAARLAAARPRQAMALATVCAACAVSIVLFFVSGRFRVPLAAVCAVLAGGALGSPLFWKGWPAGGKAALAGSMALAGIVAFSSFDNVDDRSTFVQDHVLLARAAYLVGDDATALSEAREALKMQPGHPDAKAVEKAASDEMRGRGQRP